MAEPHFLLDTNILIYVVGGTSVRLRRRVEDCEPGMLVTSTICVAEAAFGLSNDRQSTDALKALLQVVIPLPFDLRAALRFAQVPFRRGRSDRLIAAHSLALGLTLVTNNEKDFADVSELRVENWTRP